MARGLRAGKMAAGHAFDHLSPVAAFLSQGELLRWSRSITEGSATWSDRALDATYLRTHIGGGEHRLFDGGHGLTESWRRVAEARPDDSLLQELVGWLSALWKDGTTPKGLPFIGLSKDSYDSWVEHVSGIVPGLDRNWLYDLSSYDVFEILASSLGAVSVVFALNEKDQIRLAERLGSMGILSILSANPLLGIAVIASAVYAYVIRKHEFKRASAVYGATLSATSMGIFALLGFNVLIELIIVMAVCRVMKTYILDPGTLQSLLISGAKRAHTLSNDVLLRLSSFRSGTGEAEGM